MGGAKAALKLDVASGEGVAGPKKLGGSCTRLLHMWCTALHTGYCTSHAYSVGRNCMGVIVNFLMATIRRQGPSGHASSACNTVTARLDPSTTLRMLLSGDVLHELQMTPHA